MRIEVSRVIAASPGQIFAVLRDPRGHVDIDASGMLMDATGEPVSAVGDRFTMHMDRRALGDLPWEDYDVEVVITVFVPVPVVGWGGVPASREAPPFYPRPATEVLCLWLSSPRDPQASTYRYIWVLL